MDNFICIPPKLCDVNQPPHLFKMFKLSVNLNNVIYTSRLVFSKVLTADICNKKSRYRSDNKRDFLFLLFYIT